MICQPPPSIVLVPALYILYLLPGIRLAVTPSPQAPPNLSFRHSFIFQTQIVTSTRKSSSPSSHTPFSLLPGIFIHLLIYSTDISEDLLSARYWAKQTLYTPEHIWWAPCPHKILQSSGDIKGSKRTEKQVITIGMIAMKEVKTVLGVWESFSMSPAAVSIWGSCPLQGLSDRGGRQHGAGLLLTPDARLRLLPTGCWNSQCCVEQRA